MIIDAADERSEQGHFFRKAPDSSNAVLGGACEPVHALQGGPRPVISGDRVRARDMIQTESPVAIRGPTAGVPQIFGAGSLASSKSSDGALRTG